MPWPRFRSGDAANAGAGSSPVTGVVTVLLLVVTTGFLVTRARDASDDVAAAPAGSGSYGVAIGEPTAPHSVVIYEDFLCPYCGQLEQATRDDLARLAEDGAVHVEYRPYELLGHIGDYSARSAAVFAVVLEESGPAAAKRFHDLLFEHQPSESGPFPSDEHLVALAVQAGADEDRVRDGLRAGTGDAWVDQATRAAETAGVRGTPTVLLDGATFTDGRTIQELADNLVAELR